MEGQEEMGGVIEGGLTCCGEAARVLAVDLYGMPAWCFYYH